MKYSHIVIFLFNRPDNTRNLLKSLSSCLGASSSNVTIFIDGPRNNNDEMRIEESVNIIKQFNNFKSLNVIRRCENLGLARSLKSGIDYIFENNDRVIVLEDDLILSEDFLIYMNANLEKYKDNMRVCSISGYSINIDYEIKTDNFFHPRPCSWGWATWKNRWLDCDWHFKVNGVLGKIKFWYKTRKVGEDIYRMNVHHEKGLINSWAIKWTISAISKNLVTSYPRYSKVINNGFGHDATHCKTSNPFPSINDFIINDKPKLNEKVTLNSRIIKKYNYFYSNKYKLIFKGKIILNEIGCWINEYKKK